MDYKYKVKPTKKIRLKIKDIQLINQITKINYDKPGRFRIKAVFNDGTHSKFCHEETFLFPLSKKGNSISFKLTPDTSPKSFYTKQIKPPKTPELGVSTQKSIQHPLNILVTKQQMPNRPLYVQTIVEDIPAHPLNLEIETFNK